MPRRRTSLLLFTWWIILLLAANTPAAGAAGFYPQVPSDVLRPECACNWPWMAYEASYAQNPNSEYYFGPPADLSDVRYRTHGQEDYNAWMLKMMQAEGHYCNCTSTGSVGDGSTDPPPVDTIPWVVVVGVGAAAVIGIGAAARVLKGRPGPPPASPPSPPRTETPRETDEKEKEEPTRYILQLSTDRVAIDPEQPGAFTVSVWKQVGVQPPVQASEASIQITPPPGTGLVVIPAAGEGTLTVQVQTGETVQVGEFPLAVTATAGGSSQGATVMVSIEPRYTMEFA